MARKVALNSYLDLNKLLLDNYRRLGLNEEEAVFLMHLIAVHQTDNDYYCSSQWFKEITKRSSFNLDKCMEFANKLIRDGLIDIEFIDNREQCNFLSLIQKIENDDDCKEHAVEVLEAIFKRPLSNIEIQFLMDWIECGYSIDEIEQAAVRTVRNGKNSFEYLQAVLSGERLDSDDGVGIDKESERIIMDFYNMVKR